MEYEDFLKAAADRAQVGSSAEVAQNARSKIFSLTGQSLKRNAVFVEILDDGTRVVGIECNDVSKHQELFNLAQDILNKIRREAAEYRKACVDGNP